MLYYYCSGQNAVGWRWRASRSLPRLLPTFDRCLPTLNDTLIDGHTAALLTLARHAPRLRRLQLDCLTGVSAQGMQALACLSHLEALSVQETKGSVQAAARALARALLGARLGPACTIPRGPLPSACMGYAAEGALQEQQQREAGGGCLFPGQVMVGKQGEGEVEWCNGFVPLAEAAALQASVGWWMLAPES